jgi:hypothetical protein
MPAFLSEMAMPMPPKPAPTMMALKETPRVLAADIDCLPGKSLATTNDNRKN